MNSRVSRNGALGRKLGFAAAFAVALVAMVGLASSTARAAEQSLLGIRINSTAKAVLQKLGNPTRVLPGAPSSAPLSASTVTAGFGGMGGAVGPLPPMGIPGMGANMPGMMGGPPPMMGAPFGQDTSERGNMPGEFGAPGGMGGAQGFPGFGPPPGYMGQNMPGPQAGATPGQTQDQTYQNKEVTYIYDKPNGLTYAFLLSPAPGGRVIQITVAGYKSAARTSRGIALGSAYSQVLAKYGFPEQQAVEGETVFVSYAQRAHVAFQLMHNKVVSIMVAYVQ